LHGGAANVPTAEAKSLKAPTRGRLPWGKMIDLAMGWTRRIPEDFDGIVCVGEDEAERYRAKHPHVLFLPNGVDTQIFAASSSTPNSQLSTLNSQLPTILCVARIDRQKNQMMLVEWLGRHPAATVRLVGPVTQPDYRDELVARAAALGVADRLVLVGSLKPGSAELVEEYRQADVFVLPSRHEPFGIVVLEAWAAGLPVVASNVGGLGRLCAAHPGTALTFAPDDSAGLETALDRVCSDEVQWRTLSEAGRRAAASYDWDNLAARLLGFYGELC
jgi:glycosyltransferase involved in cell wall biosynthesis